MSDIADKITEIKAVVRKQRLESLATVGGGLLLFIGLGLVASYEINRMKIVQPVIEQKRSFEKEYDLVSPYKSLFKRAYDNAKNHFLENGYVNKLEIKSRTIDDVASEYSLDAQLLRTMMNVNRVYAGVDHSGKAENNRVTFVNILDPYLTLLNPRMAEVMPDSNLREGAKRLSGLMKKFNGDQDKALYAFYSPFPVEGCDNASMEGLFDKTLSNDEVVRIRMDVANIVYTIKKGLMWAGDGGHYSVWMREDAPVGFPLTDNKSDGANKLVYGQAWTGGSNMTDFQRIRDSQSITLNK